MRLVFWNCNGAFHRKADALLSLAPDVAVIGEAATPELVAKRGLDLPDGTDMLWTGRNPNKGLGVVAFNGYRLRRAEPFFPTLQHVLPVHVTGPETCNLLAAWALNLSGGITRKHQLGPMRRSMTKYRAFLSDGPVLIGGDLNHNKIWDKPGWRNNHMKFVEAAGKYGLVSAYHALTGEAEGEESEPTLYWRDRKKDGPTYHIDYVFLPDALTTTIREFSIGRFEDWCGNGLSDHMPLLIDVPLTKPLDQG